MRVIVRFSLTSGADKARSEIVGRLFEAGLRNKGTTVWEGTVAPAKMVELSKLMDRLDTWQNDIDHISITMDQDRPSASPASAARP